MTRGRMPSSVLPLPWVAAALVAASVLLSLPHAGAQAVARGPQGGGGAIIIDPTFPLPPPCNVCPQKGSAPPGLPVGGIPSPEGTASGGDFPVQFPISCIFFDTDVNNCGDCGIVCDAGEVCSNGTCSACPDGTSACNNICLDFSSDVWNCGACGVNCPYLKDGTQTCTDGQCERPCPEGQDLCWDQTASDSICKDTTSDAGNCGGCAIQCPTGSDGSSGVCKASVCKACKDSEQVCWGPVANDDSSSVISWAPKCVDQSTNPGCNICPDGQGFSYGDGTPNSVGCVDILSDPRNCGWAGYKCPATSDGNMLDCVNGVCEPCPGQTQPCWPSWQQQECVDVSSNTSYCGNCWRACPTLPDDQEQACTDGQCLPCPAGTSECWVNGTIQCISTADDPNNCGACGFSCPLLPPKCDAAGNCKNMTQQCNSGACLPCPDGYESCWSDGIYQCVTTKGNPLNCGGCGNVCPTQPLTKEGVCLSNDTCMPCPDGYLTCYHYGWWWNPGSSGGGGGGGGGAIGSPGSVGGGGSSIPGGVGGGMAGGITGPDVAASSAMPMNYGSAPSCVPEKTFVTDCPSYFLPGYNEGGVPGAIPGPPGLFPGAGGGNGGGGGSGGGGGGSGGSGAFQPQMPGRPMQPPFMKKSPPPPSKGTKSPPTRTNPSPLKKSTPPPTGKKSSPPPPMSKKSTPPPPMSKKSTPPPPMSKKSTPPPPMSKKSSPPPPGKKTTPPPTVKKSSPPPSPKVASKPPPSISVVKKPPPPKLSKPPPPVKTSKPPPPTKVSKPPPPVVAKKSSPPPPAKKSPPPPPKKSSPPPPKKNTPPPPKKR